MDGMLCSFNKLLFLDMFGYIVFVIVDAQSVQNADIAEEKGYDAGKNVWNQASCYCRYHGVAACCDCYNRQCNRSGRCPSNDWTKSGQFIMRKKLLVDGGYSGERFAGTVKELCGAKVEVVRVLIFNCANAKNLHNTLTTVLVIISTKTSKSRLKRARKRS